MAIKKLNINEFLKLAVTFPIMDVRSPGEYEQAHIPGAVSLPLFTDEERKVVGTLYKQKGRQDAIKAGVDFFGPKMRSMVTAVEDVLAARRQGGNKALIHCWRGGMRSGAVAWLLDLYGFEVYTLEGGYKAFRNWCLSKFNEHYPIRLLGGFTGSGKTTTLKALAVSGEITIDLEAIAGHKGSAFGDIEGVIQPTQEMFENLLAVALGTAHEQAELKHERIWIEDESQRIGSVNLPISFWNTMRASPLFFLDIPFEERLDNIVAEYGKIKTDRLINAIVRIRKRLGGLDAKNAINLAVEGDVKGCFSILLHYYDKHYQKSLVNRENLDTLLTKISCPTTDPQSNSKTIKQLKLPVNGA